MYVLLQRIRWKWTNAKPLWTSAKLMRSSVFVLHTNLCSPLLPLSLEQSTRQVRALEELYLRHMQWSWHSRVHWTPGRVSFQFRSKAYLLDLLQCCSDSPSTVNFVFKYIMGFFFYYYYFFSRKRAESEARKGSLPSGKEMPSHHPTDPVELRRLNFQTPGKCCLIQTQTKHKP